MSVWCLQLEVEVRWPKALVSNHTTTHIFHDASLATRVTLHTIINCRGIAVYLWASSTCPLTYVSLATSPHCGVAFAPRFATRISMRSRDAIGNDRQRNRRRVGTIEHFYWSGRLCIWSPHARQTKPRGEGYIYFRVPYSVASTNPFQLLSRIVKHFLPAQLKLPEAQQP
jgi:hypothetical protein